MSCVIHSVSCHCSKGKSRHGVPSVNGAVGVNGVTAILVYCLQASFGITFVGDDSEWHLSFISGDLVHYQ